MTDIGDLYPVTVEALDEDGEPADTTSVTLTVTLPDGTTAGPFAMTRASVGKYVYDYPVTAAGLHLWTAIAEGAVEGVYRDTFVVSSALGIVSVTEVIQALSLHSVSAKEREELLDLIRAATAACESYLKLALARVEVTETHDGGRSVVALRKAPVISVTSVAEGGVELAADRYTVDTNAGLVWRGASVFLAGRGTVVVTYVAGMPSPPADIRKAVMREVEHLYQRTKQAPHPALGAETFDELTASAEAALPPPVRYLLNPHRRVLVG